MLGRHIGQYKLLAKLGQGGMGVVYQAEDTTLKRNVALKFLAPEVLADEETQARLIREAQAAAALDHPNICHVYGIHNEGGQTFIAMAYIEGLSLAEKIKQRPLPLDEAIDIAIQIADGLQEAHEKGIVHRDIKPHNLMLTAKGLVKIMDFGLASLSGRSKITKSGTMLGTPAYMAPEQLEARGVDRRADIWALGCVLYEMLAQRSPFDAEYEQAIGFRILNEAPEPLTALRSGLPVELDRLIDKTLAKDPNHRYQHADDVIVDLKRLRRQTESGKSTLSRPTQPPIQEDSGDSARRQHSSWLAVVIVLSALLLTTISLLAWQWIGAPPTAPQSTELVKFGYFPGTAVSDPIISPDGRQIAYIAGAGANRSIWIQDLAGREPRKREGTEGAQRPFWSPDAKWIGYAVDRDLMKVPADGGPAVRVCQMPSIFYKGGAWSPDGARIVVRVFSAEVELNLFSIPAQGGDPEPVPIQEGLSEANLAAAVAPQFVPLADGRVALLFSVNTSPDAEPQIVLADLETGRHKFLGIGSEPAYSPTGHVLYAAAGAIWALPVSIESLEPAGEAFLVADRGSRPSVGADGTLVFLEGGGSAARQLVMRDRSGEKIGLIGQPQPIIQWPSVSPDGLRVAVAGFENGNWDIWIHEVSQAVKTRLTFHSERETYPFWSSSGDQVVFQAVREGSRDIHLRSADGAGEDIVALSTPASEMVMGWSPDGRHILYRKDDPVTGMDIWYLRRREGEFEEVPFLQSPANEMYPAISPDGRFLAYGSDATGRFEIYVKRFPEATGLWQVSSNGGEYPVWTKGGKELIYKQGGGTLVAAEVATDANFSVVSSQILFEHPALENDRAGVFTDGERFVISEPVEAETGAIRVVLNWHREFHE